MTVPNVTMSWCERQARCKWCPNPVEAGTPMVTVFFWNKGYEAHKGFNTKQYYHPACWVEQGLDYLKQNPYVPYNRSRALLITPEQRMERNTLLRRKCSLDQRKRRLDPASSRYPMLMARIDQRIAQLMVDIAPLGGIPKRWLEPWQP